jgi:type VI secretion system secreted protein VgrG
MPITQEGRSLFLTTPLEENFLLIKKLKASEGLNKLFQFELELLHEENDSGTTPTVVDVSQLIGAAMCVKANQNDETERFFNGICVQFNQGNRNGRYTKYRTVLVPKVWLLTQNFQSRIFQNISVPDILKKVFEGFEVDYEIQGTFEPRNYCVQYRESDFDFASRLMEEEGIFYYFEHTETEHRLIIANTPQSHRECPGRSELQFYLINDPNEWMPSVLSWNVAHQLRTGKVTLWDHNFQLPTSNLNAEHLSRFNIGGNQNLELYDYQGEYGKRFDGIDRSGGEQASQLQKVFQDRQRVAELRQQEIDVAYKNIKGSSDCSSLMAGYRFKLTDHPTAENNNFHVLVGVQIEAVQSPSYVSGEDVSHSYMASFSCIPHGTGHAPFRPIRKTRKPEIIGGQTAKVVGPAGEEIYTDKFGRVKVQFNWDRYGGGDSDSSCWIRVSQSWAGNKWGMMFIPRVGMEVVVNFLEGDPDQPIISGCVYNPESMPPYTLPDEKTKMTIKSDSTIGGGGFNEFRFEDKKNSEQIFIHGEKDLDVRIKNNSREYIGNDQHLIVKRDRRKLITRDEHQIIKRDLIEEIERDYHRHVEGKIAFKTDGSMSHDIGSKTEKVGGNYAIEAGNYNVKAKTIVLEAETGLTVKVGGNYVTVNSAGVQINGTMVLINSGGAALPLMPGTIVPPIEPEKAEIADNADPGSKMPNYKTQRKEVPKSKIPSFVNPSHKPKSPNNKDKKSWVEIELMDEDNKPVPGVRYRVTLPDGNTLAEGTLDEKGFAKVSNIDPGNCKVTFPELDKSNWKKK